MTIIETITALQFPKDEYIVVGTSIMGILGLKDVHDIDIVVTPRLFELCKNNGWQVIDYTYPDKLGQMYLKKSDVELYLDVNCRQFNPTLPELLSRVQVVEGINFVGFDDLIKFKVQYNRPKDLKDIEVIKEYLMRAN